MSNSLMKSARRHRAVTALLLRLLLACGGSSADSSTAPTSRGPANVVVSNPSKTVVNGVTRLQLHMKNEGGDGSYYLHFWGYPTAPNGPINDRGTTEAVVVTYPYEEDVAYVGTLVDWIVVYNRGTNTAVWARTQCVPVSASRPCPTGL